jgi:hypothetical protein
MKYKNRIQFYLFQCIPIRDLVIYIYNLKQQLEDEEQQQIIKYHTDNIIQSINYRIIPLHRGLEWCISIKVINHEFYIKLLDSIRMFTYHGFIQIRNNSTNKGSIIKQKSRVFKKLLYPEVYQSYLEYCYDDGRGIIINDNSIHCY